MSKRDKKKTPEQVIESGGKEAEQAFLKIPRRELVNVSKYETEDSVSFDYSKIETALEQAGKEKHSSQYSTVHTHPGERALPFPSQQDIKNFLATYREKTMFIAQLDEKGKVAGYFGLRKTKKTPEDYSEWLHNVTVSNRVAGKEFRESKDSIMAKEARLKSLARLNHLKYRFIPAQGYRFDEKKGKFVRKSEGLEKKISIVSYIALAALALYIIFNPPINGLAILSKWTIKMPYPLVGIFILLLVLYVLTRKSV